jgi:hypothetical protein
MRPSKSRATTHLLLLAVTSWFGVACSQVEIPLNLAVAPGSLIEITEIPGLPPDLNHASTILVGGVETRAVIDLDPWKLFSKNGIVGAIEVDDLLLAGEEIVFLGIIPTGTICIEPGASPPGAGAVVLQLLRHQAVFHLDLFTQIRVTDPTTAGLFGGVPLPFDATVDATIPLTLADLLGLLGGGGGLTISQELVSVLDPSLPLIGGATVTADLTLESVDEIPADPLLVDCIAP